MKRRDTRWLLAWIANLLLLWLAGLANHHLAPYAVHLHLSGLLVGYAALRLDARHGLAATALTALAADALTPVPFGTHLLLLGITHAVLLQGRHRFPREEPVFFTVVALFCNLFVFLALSFLLVGAGPRPGEAWIRLFADLVASQLVLAAVAPWFLALNARLFALARLDPETGRCVES